MLETMAAKSESLNDPEPGIRGPARSPSMVTG
jgi:hypothetical protein